MEDSLQCVLLPFLFIWYRVRMYEIPWGLLVSVFGYLGEENGGVDSLTA